MREAAERWRAKGKDVHVEHLHGHGLVAVQGPGMVDALSNNVSVPLEKLTFMRSAICTVFGIPDCRVTRCGYTGEDGVEVRIQSDFVILFVMLFCADLCR